MSDSGVELDLQVRDNESTESLDFEQLPRCTENNRLYPNNEYWLPTDDTERHRQQCEYDLFYHCFGDRLYRCPMKNPQRALDLGTGGGDWAMYFADKNPSAIVLGIDIDFQESTIDCPPNAFFEIDNWWDFLQDSDNKGKFDVVHLGSLAGSIRSWDRFLRAVWQIVRPGGCILWTEVDVGIHHRNHDTPHLYTWITEINKFSKMRGMALNLGRRMRSLLDDAGFRKIDIHTVRVPLTGTNAREQLNRHYTLSSIEPVSLRPLTRTNWSWIQLKVLWALARNEVRQCTRHCRTRCFSAYAERPLAYSVQ